MSFFAIDQILAILDTQPGIQDIPTAIDFHQNYKKIQFINVNFEYIKGQPVLKNVNLFINKGEKVALVGNSGGGKTTLVNLIPRFYDVTSGNITIDDIDIRGYKMKSLRDNISVVFQDNFLFSGTIRDNIMLGNENATDEQVKNAINMAYLDEFVATLDNGIDTIIGEKHLQLNYER